MSSRDTILKAIRNSQREATPLPTLEQNWLRFDDPVAHFTTVLQSVGGKCIRVSSTTEIDEQLNLFPQFESASVRTSAVEGVGKPTVNIDSINDPHELENIDFAVLEGQIAVAENGAVWVTDKTLKHRVLYFIAQHLALVVRTSSVVNNMHEAYRQLSFESPRFGAFVSGPSKTADIEQSLVIGAHGPRSHIVFLVDDES
ncbi:MAG: LUD domain-containing protein [Planctomycetota bacterium]|nr:LUD domain-containing protein [Planctomycetota bacterium]